MNKQEAIKSAMETAADEGRPFRVFCTRRATTEDWQILPADWTNNGFLIDPGAFARAHARWQKKTIYQKLKAIGAELASWQSDLYVKRSVEVDAIVATVTGQQVKPFTGTDNAAWYEIAFAFDPFWKKANRACNRAKKGGKAGL